MGNEKEAVFEDGPRGARMLLLLEVIVLQRDVVSLCSGARKPKVQASKRCWFQRKAAASANLGKIGILIQVLEYTLKKFSVHLGYLNYKIKSVYLW